MWREPMAEPNFPEVTIRYLDDGKVAIISLNRVKKHNAIIWDHFYHLKACFEYLGRNGSDVRAIVFTGAGKNFTSGIDLFTGPIEFLKLKEKADDTDPGRAAIEFFPIVEAL